MLNAVPDGACIEGDRTGNYRSKTQDLLARLTVRERETLRAAAELGYYRTPREATSEDITAVVGRAAGTVGDPLRDAEAKIVGRLVAPENPKTETHRNP
ncbi:hypothetical protein BRC90_06335 [Halobacteriales archaeon QS_4_69_34]|nr:MAG: hypothetical protein BRC90_06335 [Halobacteriales archaeon QS_4_69_34]